MDNKLRSILSKFWIDHQNNKISDIAWKGDAVDQAIADIKAIFLAELPEEITGEQLHALELSPYPMQNVRKGFDLCLAQVRARLEGSDD